MSDSFTEVTRTSWGGRLKNAIGGIFIGIILIIAGVILLSWNEGRTVKTKRALNEGAGLVVSMDANNLNPANDGKLVHTTGTATTEDILSDDVFGVKENAIHIRRSVMMYQWKEKSETKTQKKIGGSEEKVTIYNYTKEWNSKLLESTDFKNPTGHQNPASMAYESRTTSASTVHLGQFSLSASQIGMIDGYESISISSLDFSSIDKSSVLDNYVYIGTGTAQSPEIGDLKISFTRVNPKTVSLVAQQAGNSFSPYLVSNGEKINLLTVGVESAEVMFQNALDSNKMMGNILRLVGFLMLVIGFMLIFKPLSVLADVIPLIGNIVGFGTGILAFLLGLIISLVTIAIAWIAYRPFIAIPLLAAAAFLIGLSIRRAIHKRKAAKA